MSAEFDEDFLLLFGKMLWVYVYSEKVRMPFARKDRERFGSLPERYFVSIFS